MDRKHQSGFDWGKYLVVVKSEAAPVQLFNHAQMSSNWSEIESGVKVEVINHDCLVASKVYWIAQIIKVAGYKVLLRYEGFGDDDLYDFWCNLCNDDVHAVGWCATVGKPLVPPRTIQFKYSNWKSFLIERLTGSKTLPNDFPDRVEQSLECPFLHKMRVEVMDKTQISRKRIGIVEQIVGGRLRLQYEDSDESVDDFWCHCHSFLIHPVGWSERIGHRILVANKDYKNVPGFKNAKPDSFVSVKTVKTCGFKTGMKLEAIDPLNLSSICVATVRKVLKNGYLMIGIDGSEAAEGSDWFCYHCTSPSIFPVGFCKANSITLSTPNNYKSSFKWNEYLKETNADAAPSHIFANGIIDHGFTVGMKLEAVDLMEPRLLCVATVTRVVGRLLRIHFDGWDVEYDQWIDSQSPDIYPVGWCELVRYDLQPPVNYKISLGNELDRNKRKSKTKSNGLSGKKKRKKLSHNEKNEADDGVDANDASDLIADMDTYCNNDHFANELNGLRKKSSENRSSSPLLRPSKENLKPPDDLDLSFPDDSEDINILNVSNGSSLGAPEMEVDLGPPANTETVLPPEEEREYSGFAVEDSLKDSSTALLDSLPSLDNNNKLSKNSDLGLSESRNSSQNSEDLGQVPEAQAQTSEDLPEADAHASEDLGQVPEAQAQTSEDLPEADSQASEDLGQVSEAEASQASQDLGQVPEAQVQDSEDLTEADAQDSEDLGQVPGADAQDSVDLGQVPEAEAQNSEGLGKVPEAEAQDSEDLGKVPEAEAQDSEDLEKLLDDLNEDMEITSEDASQNSTDALQASELDLQASVDASRVSENVSQPVKDGLQSTAVIASAENSSLQVEDNDSCGDVTDESRIPEGIVNSSPIIARSDDISSSPLDDSKADEDQQQSEKKDGANPMIDLESTPESLPTNELHASTVSQSGELDEPVDSNT